MQRSPRTAALRLPLLTLLALALLVAIVEPALGGTEAAPEIQDAAADQSIVGTVPSCPDAEACLFSGIDIVTAWIGNETAADFQYHIRFSGGPGALIQANGAYAAELSIADTVYEATVEFAGGPLSSDPTVGGVASAAVVDETLLSITILKSAVGAPAAGATATGFAVTAEYTDLVVGVIPLASDEAAAAEGTTYIFTGGSTAPVDPDDTDGDGLNDTCEQQYFGNLTAANATGDADGDGLTNGQECALGTDPTKADTDGDGVNDKDDPFPTDPTRGGTGSTSSTSSTRPPTTSRSTTSTGANQQGEDDDGDIESFGDAVDKLKADPGYLGLSGGGFLAVLVLCILALAVRWSL